MNELIISKLKLARKSLDLAQKSKDLSGVMHQPGISRMEKGGRNNVPMAYLNFMANHGVDLSAVFSDNISVDQYKNMGADGSLKVAAYKGTCPSCIVKDDMLKQKDVHIDSLLETIDTKNELISMLKEVHNVSKAG
jgi:hypothetical protein